MVSRSDKVYRYFTHKLFSIIYLYQTLKCSSVQDFNMKAQHNLTWCEGFSQSFQSLKAGGVGAEGKKQYDACQKKAK